MGSFYSERSVEKLLGVLNQFYSHETLQLKTLKQYRQKWKQKAKWTSIEEDDHDASSTRKQNAMRAAVQRMTTMLELQQRLPWLIQFYPSILR